MMEYNADTGDLTIFSASDGRVLLELRIQSFHDANKIEEAIRTAENKAGEAARVEMIGRVRSFYE